MRLDDGLVLLLLKMVDVFLEGIIPVRMEMVSVDGNACPW
jgi:hypothetical protein